MSTRAGWSIPSPVKFGTSGWRGVIAEDFTFANVRLALTAIAEHVKAESAEPTILVAYDTRFYSEEFSQLAVDILEHHGVRALLCETFTPTPAVAYEIMRRKLDGAVGDHGVAVAAIRTGRDCLFDGTGPDVSEENLAPLKKVVVDSKATAGLATDGDADRFGIVDRDGTWIQPNLILALVYDYLAETRQWKMPAARSVATTQMIDAVAKSHGQGVHQTPVGFKYIGQLIREDKIALGGEESAGLTIRGHIPEKDGILACLLVAEMIAARGAPLGEQIRATYKKLGREFWPVRENLHLSDEQKANAVCRVGVDSSTLLGRKVVSIDRTDGAKFVFEDGSWMLLRLSGTEPLLRLYVEAESAAASAKLTSEATKWVLQS